MKLRETVKVALRGVLRRGRSSPVDVTVTDQRGKAVRGATVRFSGAARGSKRTNRRGIARLRVRPKRTGDIAVRVTQRRYRTTFLRTAVR